MKLLWIIFSSLVVMGYCTRLGGLYYENEDDQTIAHRFDTRREKRAFAKKVFRVLELPRKPLVPRNRTVRSSDVPASKFMHDVYRITQGEKAQSFRFDNEEIETIGKSDVVLTYTSLRKLELQSKDTLRFDISETPMSIKVIRSELKLYVKPPINSSWTISLYDSQGYVNSTNVSSEGWIKLSMKNVLNRWLNCSKCDRELHLSTFNLENEVNDNEIIVHDDPSKRGFLVGYFSKIDDVRNHQHTASVWRSDRSTKNQKSRNFLENPYSGVRETYRGRKTSCALRSLHVRFRELDFDRYIVEPEGFDAAYCYGECRFPLHAHLNATNHALVQTLVHFLRPSLAPRVSCAPRKYADLPVFYSRDGENYVLKKYRRMVVTSCGCC